MNNCGVCSLEYDSNMLVEIYIDCNNSICHHCLLKIRKKHGWYHHIIKCPFCRQTHLIDHNFICKMFETRVKKYKYMKNELLLNNKNELILYIRE